MKKLWLRDRFLFLLLSLVILFVISPILADLNFITMFMEIFMTLVMILALGASQDSKRQITTALILAVPAVAFGWLAQFFPWQSLKTLNAAFDLVFLVFIFVNLMRIILTSKQVTTHVIYGAMCAYLMLGLAYSELYMFMIIINPASFTFSNGNYVSVETFRHIVDVFYFSFVSLTTLGYGDIIPTTSISRMLSSLEALTGQLFIAIIIARLVAMHTSHKSRKNTGTGS
jgi:hypothetical protein